MELGLSETHCPDHEVCRVVVKEGGGRGLCSGLVLICFMEVIMKHWSGHKRGELTLSWTVVKHKICF